MAISSFVVDALPADLDQVANQLQQLAGVELCGRGEQGLAVVWDYDASTRAEDMISQLWVKGVRGVSLVFASRQEE